MKLYVFIAQTAARYYKVTVYSTGLADAEKLRDAALSAYVRSNIDPAQISITKTDVDGYLYAKDMSVTIMSIFDKSSQIVPESVDDSARKIVDSKREILSVRSTEINLLKMSQVHFSSQVLEGIKVFNEYHGRNGDESELQLAIFSESKKLLDEMDFPVKTLLDDEATRLERKAASL